jgi:hypothetical protein
MKEVQIARRGYSYWSASVSLLVLLLVTGSVGGETPRDELLRLVPEDVGICMIVQDLRDHVRALEDSPFMQQLRASSVGISVRASPDAGKLRDVEKYLQTELQIGWDKLLDDVFGDAIVLAYWPGPPGKQEQEKGVILIRPRDSQLISQVLERVSTVAKQPPPENRSHHGSAYSVWKDGNKTTYSYLDDTLFAVSHQEELLQRIIERRKAAFRTEPALDGQLRRLGLEKDLAVVWINPRAFDPELEHKTQVSGIDAEVRKAVLAHWKAVDGIALAARLGEKQAELRMAFSVDASRWPDPGRLLFQPGQASELWNCFPEEAMLAVAGRVDAAAVAEMAAQFMDDKGRQAVRAALDRYAKGSIGRDVQREVFPGLGPDWGFCVVPPPASEKAWYPYLIGALRVQPGKEEPPLDRALGNFLNGMAMFAVVAHNSAQADALSLHSEMQGNVEVKYFVNEKSFPVGFRPGFAMKDGYLVVGSSPDAIRLFRGSASKKAAISTGETPWLRLSAAALRRYLGDRSQSLVSHLAAQERIPLDEAERRLNALREALGLIEGVEVTQRSTTDQFHLILRVRTAAPLRK